MELKGCIISIISSCEQYFFPFDFVRIGNQFVHIYRHWRLPYGVTAYIPIARQFTEAFYI